MKLKRSMLKAEYARFCEAWNNEKTYQRILMAEGVKVEETETKLNDGTNLKVLKSGDQQLAVLGKKPTFAMWLHARKHQTKMPDAMKAVSEKQVPVTDKEW